MKWGNFYIVKMVKKKSNKLQQLKKALSKPIKSKKILKHSTMTATIQDYKAPSILDDENRFFKGQMEDAKKSMFLS